MVVSELRGEKIDIIPHNDEPARFVAKALSPARVREVIVDDEERQATVIVPDDQLSLAIGRDGQNARLAARLTGWRVDIKSETEFAQEDQDDRVRGRRDSSTAAAWRCSPTAAAAPTRRSPGSTYCGLPQHQALCASRPTRSRSSPTLSEAEVEILADPDADEGQVDEIVAQAEAELRRGRAEARRRGGRGAPTRPPRRRRRGGPPSSRGRAERCRGGRRRGAEEARPRTPLSEEPAEPVAEEAEQA